MTVSWIEDRTRYNEDTLFKVQRALHNAGLSNNQNRDCITEMLNEGILFRERLDDPAERSGWEDADVAQVQERDCDLPEHMDGWHESLHRFVPWNFTDDVLHCREEWPPGTGTFCNRPKHHAAHIDLTEYAAERAAALGLGGR